MDKSRIAAITTRQYLDLPLPIAVLIQYAKMKKIVFSIAQLKATGHSLNPNLN